MKAAQLDPSTPYLFHELARIAFLRGNLTHALALIDVQISLYGDTEPNSYYVRGLIEGYMGNYDAAITDYTHFLTFDSQDWAAMNDDAWVLLKAGKFQQAADITAKGLTLFPENPWLLNSRATALYELGNYSQALAVEQRASMYVGSVSQAAWLHSYPGNDPENASAGIASFTAAVAENMHRMELAVASSTVQSK